MDISVKPARGIVRTLPKAVRGERLVITLTLPAALSGRDFGCEIHSAQAPKDDALIAVFGTAVGAVVTYTITASQMASLDLEGQAEKAFWFVLYSLHEGEGTHHLMGTLTVLEGNVEGIETADPGLSVYTPEAPQDGTTYGRRNGAWVAVGGGGGGGPVSWDDLLDTPTTLAGYGITDAAAASHTHAFSALTSKPTTLAGYGITDAAAASHTHAFSTLTGKPTTLAGYGITDAATASHTHAFSAITGTPTTLAGYGITDGARSSDLAAKADLIDGLVPNSQLPSASSLTGFNSDVQALINDQLSYNPISGYGARYGGLDGGVGLRAQAFRIDNIPGLPPVEIVNTCLGESTAPVFFNITAGGTAATQEWVSARATSDIWTFLGTPTSANLRAALSDEAGTGAAYFVGGALGTPASGTLTNCTALPVGGISATGTPSSTTYLRGDGSWATPAGSGGVVAGSVDNAILRADGTGGSTSQGSDLLVEDAATATQNNVCLTNNHSGQTNSALVLCPKGNGAFIIGPKPTGSSTSGNARGANAFDGQSLRNAADQVASGTEAVVLGSYSKANGSRAVAIGYGVVSSGTASAALGGFGTASGDYSLVAGFTNTASATGTTALGVYAAASRYGELAMGGSRRSVNGDRQSSLMTAGGTTTSTTAVELFLDGSAQKITIPANAAVALLLQIVGKQASSTNTATFTRRCTVINNGGTLSLSTGGVVTIGTDDDANAWGAPQIDAQTTGAYCRLRVTGPSSLNVYWSVSALATTAA